MISRLDIGSDVSKKWFDVLYLINKEEQSARYLNTEAGFAEFIQCVVGLAKRVHVCMEFTGGYETKLALACKAAGLRVSIVDGAKIHHYRRSFSSSGSSTDKRSAYLLARYSRERKPEEWFPVPDEYRILRELVRHRERLVEGKTEWASRSAHCVELELVAAQRRTFLEVFKLQIAQAEAALADHIEAHPHLAAAVKLLDTIPGVAFVSACRILAEAGPIENYSSAKSLALAAGLVPVNIHSGMHTPAARLPIYGNRELRCGLYFPAVVCFGKEIGVGPFMKRVASRGEKLKRVVLTAGMRKMAHVVYGVLTSGEPYNPDRLIF
jgi:transposase